MATSTAPTARNSTTGRGSKDKTFKLYQGHYHDLLNDLGKEQVMADVLTWLNKHIQLKAVASV